jgi:hypothetical protein
MTTQKTWFQWLETCPDTELLQLRHDLELGSAILEAQETRQRKLTYRMALLMKLDSFIDEALEKTEESDECTCDLYSMSNAYGELLALACHEIGKQKELVDNLQIEYCLAQNKHNSKISKLRKQFNEDNNVVNLPT